MLRQQVVGGVRSFTSASSALRRTVLHDFHVGHGGSMVDFCGWSLPVLYKGAGQLGLKDSALWTRSDASLFDVSHMGQLKFRGADRVAFLERLVVSNLKVLKPDQGRYTLLTNEHGGVIDDTVITKRTDHLYMVINAARVHVDMPHIEHQLQIARDDDGLDVELEFLHDRSLVALQGPKAVGVLQDLSGNDLSKLGFFYQADMNVAGIPATVTRCGYTGEDGFEIAMDSSDAVQLTESLVDDDRVALAGLGARDALRLEAGLALYGNDLDETTTPVEAGLMWTCAKKRRETGQFIGADAIRKQFAQGPKRKLVGLAVTGAPARQHAELVDDAGEAIGEVTSGGFSPTLKRGIAMAYVKAEFAATGTKFGVKVRGRTNEVEVVDKPFVPNSYYKLP